MMAFNWNNYQGGKKDTEQHKTSPLNQANIEERIEELQNDIDRVDTMALSAAENGLFKVQDKITLKDIQNLLQEARDNADPNSQNFSITNCQTTISIAAGRYYDATFSTTWLWRFNNIYGGLIWFYLIAFLVSVFLFYYIGGDAFFMNQIDQRPGGIMTPQSLGEDQKSYYHNGIYAITWGLIGGVLRGIWFLKENVDKRQYRNAWTVWFISTPFLGAILGITVYLIVIAGLITITGNDTDIKNPLAVMAISIVAGFSWPSSVATIKRVAESISGSKS